jgi:hypothetical protein
LIWLIPPRAVVAECRSGREGSHCGDTDCSDGLPHVPSSHDGGGKGCGISPLSLHPEGVIAALHWYYRLLRVTHCLTHSLSHSLTHSLTHCLTHSLTHSLTHCLTHSLTHSLSHSLTHSLTHCLTHSLSHSLTHCLTHSLSTVQGTLESMRTSSHARSG